MTTKQSKRRPSVVILFAVITLCLPAEVSCLVNQPRPKMTRAGIGPPRGVVNETSKKTVRTPTAIDSKLDVEEDPPTVEVGSKEYYSGFVSRGLVEPDEDRVTGDAILGPTVKFVGGFSVLIGALFVFFMVSNGLL
jgi:hypothetical protein